MDELIEALYEEFADHLNYCAECCESKEAFLRYIDGEYTSISVDSDDGRKIIKVRIDVEDE